MLVFLAIERLLKPLGIFQDETICNDVLKEASDRIVSKWCGVGLLVYLTLAKLALLWLPIIHPGYWFAVQFNWTLDSSEISFVRKCPSFVKSNTGDIPVAMSYATGTTFLRLFHCSFYSFCFLSQTSELELENFFSSFGEVVDVRIVCDRKTGLNKGWGFRVNLLRLL